MTFTPLSMQSRLLFIALCASVTTAIAKELVSSFQSNSELPELDHCRFLFHSPSYAATPLKNGGKGSHEFVAISGRFASPTAVKPGKNRDLLLQSSRICEFAFIGSPDEKVDITFTDFDFPGHPPQCKKAYLDIVFQSEVTEFRNFVELKHENRYCGKDLVNVPHRLISSHQSVFMLMDTMALENNTEWRGFKGTFSFIPARQFHVGTSLPPSAGGSSLVSAATSKCGGQLIRSSVSPFGIILSPNYPGLYGDDTYCFWRLIGTPGERIRLTFNDFGLFYGDEQCPFDFVNIYDGYNAWSPLLKTMCGQLRDGDVVLYSRGYEMFIEFVTGRGRYDSRTYAGLPYWMPRDDYSNKRRGFKATFEFSTGIVPLDSLLGPHAAHIAGSECDQLVQNANGRVSSLNTPVLRIAGQTESTNGPIAPISNTQTAVFSPFFPSDAPDNISCTYHFYGRMERDYIDKVRLLIDDFGEESGEIILNNNMVTDIQHCPTEDPDGFYVSPGNGSNVNASEIAFKSYVMSFYSAGLSSLSESQIRNQCPTRMDGENAVRLKRGAIIESLGPNLTLSFTTLPSMHRPRSSRRFLIKYAFIRDFHVTTAGTGKQITDYVCHYVFNSSTFEPAFHKQSNTNKQYHNTSPNFVSMFTSPHFPRPYPDNVRCVYDFIIDRKKFSQLRVWFELFEVGETLGYKQRDRLKGCLDQDHVSVFQLLPSSKIVNTNQDKRIGTYSLISFSALSSPVRYSALCGRYLPGPLVSDPEALGLQFVFTSQSSRDAGVFPSPPSQTDYRGFRANFEFIANVPKTNQQTDFNGSTKETSTLECPSNPKIIGRKGTVISPGYPNSFYPSRGLICDWTLEAITDKARLQLMLTDFELEGAYSPKNGLENCQKAVVELYTGANLDQPTHLRCSSASALTGQILLTQGNKARIRFLTSPASTGGPGFRIDWNEIYDINETECKALPATYIWCESASRCINAELRCDGIPHCGLLDLTDEENCVIEPPNPASMALIVAGGIAALLSLIVILLVVICRIRQQRMYRKQTEKELSLHVCETGTEHKSQDNVNDDIPKFTVSKHKSKGHATCDAQTTLLSRAHMNGNRNKYHPKCQKKMEEAILIDAESVNGNTNVTAIGNVKKMQLFEKITIV